MLIRYQFLTTAFLVLLISSSNAVADQENKPNGKNPFEMVIFNLGRNNFSEPKIKSSTFTTIQKTYHSSKNKIDELSVEVPFYKDYVALGFEFDMFYSSTISGTAYTPLVKFRFPIQLNFGHIALTNTYRAGITSLLFHDINDKSEINKFGATAISSVGIDYFPIRWFGIYYEYSWRYSNIFRNKQPEAKRNEPYSFTTGGFSFGFKFTF